MNKLAIIKGWQQRCVDTDDQMITTSVLDLLTLPYFSLLDTLIKESGVKCQHLLPRSLSHRYFNELLIVALQLRQLAQV